MTADAQYMHEGGGNVWIAEPRSREQGLRAPDDRGVETSTGIIANDRQGRRLLADNCRRGGDR